MVWRGFVVREDILVKVASSKSARSKSVPVIAPAADTRRHEWEHALVAFGSQVDPHQAALCFTACSTVLQGMIEDRVITSGEYLKLRSDLMTLWAERVRLLEASDAIPVDDEPRPK